MSGWRVVVVSSRAKLELKLNYLVVRGHERVSRIHLSEISTLLIENTAVSLTCSLVEALSREKINVIFCDSRHLPMTQLVAYAGSHDSTSKIYSQLDWTDEAKAFVWAQIVKAKISKQAECLRRFSPENYKRLMEYVEDVEEGDISNREGHAAKVYFNALFGHDFFRSVDSKTNSALDYGYSIILASVAREIVANGYLPQLGIFHHNVFNAYNLASDLMEPFRPLVDLKVAELPPGGVSLSADDRYALVNILNLEVYIDGGKTTVANAIRIYVKSVINALDNADPSQIKMYTYGF